jgi:hypothetical protein
MPDTDMNYVVGRGRLFFGQFKPNSRKARGQLYFGNTPALSLSQSEDMLDHYSSEGGVRVKDASVSLQNDSSGSFQCDNISLPNLALWFRGYQTTNIEVGSATASGTVTFSTTGPEAGDTVTIGGQALTFVAADPVGTEVLIGATLVANATNLANAINDLSMALGVTATANAAVTTIRASAPGSEGNEKTLAKNGDNITVSGATLAGGTDVTETITGVERGRWYQLGVTADQPQGVSQVGGVTIEGVEDSSLIIDAAAGRFFILEDAQDVVNGDDLEVSYGVIAGVDDIVVARSDTIEGEMAFIANNAAGSNDNYFWPYVKISPDGDLSLKGDEWMNMTFNFEILKRDALTERQYITRRRAA